VLVVDASVLAVAIADDGADGDACRAGLARERLAAPDLLRLEVMSVFRRQAAGGTLSPTHVRQAVQDLLDFPIVVYPTAPLLVRCWELRHNVGPYDAAYVALAEATDSALLTSDARLAAAPGIRCRVELL
jgi:predicted nucleic acid-binding protein